MRSVIAGGGIGGLTTALALCRIGWEVTVIEQASAFSEVGAGIQLSPNGVRLLDDLGVMPFLEPHIFEPESIEMRNGVTGRQVFSLPLREHAVKRWGARYLNVYRPDLIDALLQTLQPFMASAQLTLVNGKRVLGYQHEPGAVSVQLDSPEVINAQLLVGADGILSRLRNQMHGAEEPRFTGQVAWRAVIPIERLGTNPPGPTACIWTGEGKHAVTTRICGGEKINFVGCVEQDSWREEGWRIRGSSSEALADFSGWNSKVTDCIEAADELYRWALYDRKPLASWSDGRVVLIGDAAHPMLPSMAQGAVQAIEDAWVLARLLSTLKDNDPEVESIGHKLFTERINRTTRVQKVSANNMRLFHTRGRLKQRLMFEPARLAGQFLPSVLLGMNDWLYAKKF